MKKLKIILLNFIVLGGLILGLEYFASVFLQKDDNNTNNNRFAEIKEKAYAELEDEFKTFHSHYYCPREKIISKDTDGSFVRYKNQNWSCAGISVKDNKRVTTYQPVFFERKVHVFGGSTIFGTGSSDNFTIPSLLQKELNKKNYKTKVINHGFSSFVVTQQLQRLLKIPIKKNDIVIFYDGANDVVQREIYQKSEGSIIGYNQDNRLGFFFSDLRNFLAGNSKFYNLSSKIKKSLRGELTSKNITKCTVDNFNKIDFKKTWASYYDSLIKAKNYTESNGGIFYHFLQPTLNFHLLKKSDYNYLKAIGETNTSSLCFLELSSGHYKNLNNSYKNRLHKFNGTSLSDIFYGSSFKNPGYYFMDFVHITPHGNKLVADSIFNKIDK